MNSWQIARYLIDAKKEVDALWYIAANANKLNVNIRRLVERRRNIFYINAAAVVDKYIENQPEGTNRKSFKKSLQDDLLIKILYTYRDKHSAHKDDDFQDSNFVCLMEIVRECMAILDKVRTICRTVLPEEISLNYVCYDADLFRLQYGISKELENKIKNQRYIFHTNAIENPLMQKNIFYDTEDLWKVENPDAYCVVWDNGLVLEEGIQNRQDAAIKTNVLYGQSIWVYPVDNIYRINLMKRRLGYEDVFMRQMDVQKTDSELQQDLILLQMAEKSNVLDYSIDDALIYKAISSFC